ncbi:hypothetical protein ACCI51_07645 [Microbulbifer echini]|uniref:Lipoprotein n=1 Tax=Microbulbifer echini TaxID=1529067 RepID=A0ABV4NLZ5_9GAMM
MRKAGLLFLIFFALVSCAPPPTSSTSEDTQEMLYQYAQANCLFWYFKEKGYDTDEIRSIAGGIVEHSDVSADKFQEISLFIKNYSPNLKSKNNINVSLSKCFNLKKSEGLRNIIDK